MARIRTLVKLFVNRTLQNSLSGMNAHSTMNFIGKRRVYFSWIRGVRAGKVQFVLHPRFLPLVSARRLAPPEPLA
jgi:hypothetical protein